MAKPKYNFTIEIVKDIDALNKALRVKKFEDRKELLALIKRIRESVISFDNDVWEQSGEMSEYLPV